METITLHSLTLDDLGLVYQLGHQGSPCQHPDLLIRWMVLMDTTGIHRIQYRYCKCSRSATSDNLRQLLCNAWFPATQTDPTTCATFKVLDLFWLLAVIAGVNVHNFVRTLEQFTNVSASTGLKALPVCMASSSNLIS
jgi:hypothetical protein